MCGDVGVGELGPTPNDCHDDAARRHLVGVPNLRDTFHEGGVEVFEKGPPHPLPKRAFAVPTPGECMIPCLLLTEPGVEQQLENFLHHFLVATAHALINLFNSTSQSFASTIPQSTM